MTIIKSKVSLVLCCMALFVSGITLSLTGILLPSISESFQLTNGESGMYLSLNFAGYMSLVLFGGVFAEKFGKKRTLFIAVLGSFIAAVSMIFADSYWHAAAMAFLLAGFSGILESMGCSIISEIDSNRTHHYVNLAMGFMTAGYLFGAVFSGAFTSAELNWRIVYTAVCVIAFINALIFRNTKLENKKTIKQKLDFKEIGRMLSNQYFIFGCICMLLYTGIEVTFFSWLTTYFTAETNITFFVSILIMGVFYLAMILGRIIYGALLKKFKAANIAILSCILTAPLVVLIMQLDISWFIYIAIFMLGILISGVAPYIISATGQLTTSDSAYSIILGSGGIGTVLIPGLIGLVGDALNIRIAITFLAPFMLIIALIIWFKIKPQLTKLD